MKARVWIRQGRLSDATGWATDRGVSATDEARFLSEFDHLTLVRLLIAQHRERPSDGGLDLVAGLLDRLEAAAVPAGRAGSVLEIRMLRSLADDAQGRRSNAVDDLADALAEVPEPDGYARLFVDEGRWMTALLREVTRHDAAAEQARRILASASTPGARTSATATLSDRELQVLRLLDSELSGPEIARRLFVSPNTLRTHTKHIFTKLDVTSRRAAVRQARERGLM